MIRLLATGARVFSPSLVRLLARYSTFVWQAVAAAVMLTIVGVGWWLAAGAVSAATGAETRLVDLWGIAADELLSAQSTAVADLRDVVSQVREGIEPTRNLMRWVWRFSPGYAGLPGIQREVATWADQVERVELDLMAASALVESSARLWSVYDSAQALLQSTGGAESVAALRPDVARLRLAYDRSTALVEDSDRLGRTFGVGLQAPRLRRLSSLLDDIEGEMSSASGIGLEVSGLLSELLEVAEGARPLLDQFAAQGSDSTPWIDGEMRAALTRLREHTISAKTRADSVARLISDSGQGTQFVEELEDLGRLLDVLRVVSEAGATGLDALQPAVELVEASEGGLLSSEGVLIQVLEAVLERREDLATSITELREARRLLDELAQRQSDGALAGGLSGIAEVVENLYAGFTLVDTLAPMGAAMLGTDGPRTYLVLGQSADELRGVGGYVSSVWRVTFDKGYLTGVVYQDSVRVDDWGRLGLYPEAPPGLDEHMNAWVWLLRDVTWDPDFPTTARSAADLYRLGQRLSVDGVVAINQWTLLELVKSLGDIESPGGGAPLTARNLLSALEEGTDDFGRAYMDLVLQGVLDKLKRPMSMPELIRLASAMFTTLQRKDMLLFFEDPDLQAAVARAGWDGRMRREPGDYLDIVDSNVGWSKVDRNIQRDVIYRVDLSRESRPRATLTLGYGNHSGPGSAGCEPQWINRGTDYSQLKNACYWNYLRVYMPQESRLLSSTPLPLPESTVSVEIGRGTPGQETGIVSSSHGRMVFSGLTYVAAGERGEVSLVYDLPESVLVRGDDTLTYRLLIQKQPGVRRRSIHVEIVLPDGFRLSASSVAPTRTTATLLAFDLDLERDELLSVELTKAAYDAD